MKSIWHFFKNPPRNVTFPRWNRGPNYRHAPTADADNPRMQISNIRTPLVILSHGRMIKGLICSKRKQPVRSPVDANVFLILLNTVEAAGKNSHGDSAVDCVFLSYFWSATMNVAIRHRCMRSELQWRIALAPVRLGDQSEEKYYFLDFMLFMCPMLVAIANCICYSYNKLYISMIWFDFP